jgi:hypothetical protein
MPWTVHALDRGLQPPRHGDVVGVNAPAVLGQLALKIENVPRTRRAGDDAPKARICRVGAAIGLAEADERIFAGQDHAIGVGGHASTSLQAGRTAMLGHGRRRRYADTQHSGPLSISLTAGKNAFLFVELVLSTAKIGSMSVAWIDRGGSASSGIFGVSEQAGRELAAEFGARPDA